MTIPPWNADPARVATAMKDKDAYLEEVGRLYGGEGLGKIHFFELGNEPDLAGFYPGSPANYVQTFEEMRDSIKRGNGQGGAASFGDGCGHGRTFVCRRRGRAAGRGNDQGF